MSASIDIEQTSIENDNANQICIQDFILLCDFIPLPEIIMIFSKGKVDQGQGIGREEALLKISKIQNILTKLG